jgi:hypothetical protein
MDQISWSTFAVPSTPEIRAVVPLDREAEIVHRNIDLATHYSSQIRYCEQCQQLIKFLRNTYLSQSSLDNLLLDEFDLGVKTIVSGVNCCLCMLIQKACGHWLENEDIKQLTSLKATGVKYGGSFLLKYGELKEPLSMISESFHDSLKWSCYEHLVTESTDSDECWNLANRWLKNCESGHDCGDRSHDHSLPTRLVKVNVCPSKPCPYLIESHSLPVRVEYCTLSHCWGDGNFLQLTRANYDKFHQTIPYDSLSKTFQDAIYAAQRLGFQYIWIDSLCIIQKDEEDWSKEAGTMGQVYAGSTLNLAATSAKNGQDGLFRSRNPKAVLPCIVEILDSPNKETLIYRSGLWENEIEESFLSSRAWVFQERILATRTLHFASDQLFWECTAGTACETQPWDPILDMTVLGSEMLDVRGTDLEEAFRSAVKHYSRGKLSFESDKFVAFAGIARYLSEKGFGGYIAGLWRDKLEMQLLWRTLENGTRPVRYRAPSWTWMAIDGAEIILYLLEARSRRDDVKIQVLDIFIKPRVDGNVFGQINFASLTIRCRKMKKVKTVEDLESDEVRGMFDDHKEIFMANLDSETTERASQEVFLLHILTSDDKTPIQHRLDSMEGLLLQRSTRGRNWYERIGKFQIYSPVTVEHPIDSADDDGKNKVRKRSQFLLWTNLEDAEMQLRAPEEIDSSSAANEEHFIITLV